MKSLSRRGDIRSTGDRASRVRLIICRGLINNRVVRAGLHREALLRALPDLGRGNRRTQAQRLLQAGDEGAQPAAPVEPTKML